MEVNYKSGNGQFEVNVEGTAQEVFEQIANFQEVFDRPIVINGQNVPSSEVHLRVRTVDDNKYYEMAYVGGNKDLWGYKLRFGCAKKGGGLFPKYQLGENENKDDYVSGGNGWFKYVGGKSQESSGDNKSSSKSKTEKAPF
jgi:hypothetical protein